MLDLRGGLKNSCDVYFYEVARRTGIDRIAAMANRLGLGVELELDLPGQRAGPDPDAGVAGQQGPCLEHGRHHRQRHRPGVYPGDAVAARHLCLAHRQRAAGAAASDPQAGRRDAAGRASRRTGRCSGMPEKLLHTVREGMWAVVNEPGGTAPLAGWPIRRCSWPARPDRRRSGGCRANCARAGISTARNCPGNTARTRCSSPMRRTTRRATPLAVVIEHGNAGAAAAAPMARQIMTEVLRRDPANRTDAPPAPGRPGQVRRYATEDLMDRRLWREPSFDLMGKVLQVNWLYVLLLCCLAGGRLHRALQRGRRRPRTVCDPPRHALRGRRWSSCWRSAWSISGSSPDSPGRPGSAAWSCWCWCCAWAMSARARSAGSSSAACSCSRRR